MIFSSFLTFFTLLFSFCLYFIRQNNQTFHAFYLLFLIKHKIINIKISFRQIAVHPSLLGKTSFLIGCPYGNPTQYAHKEKTVDTNQYISVKIFLRTLHRFFLHRYSAAFTYFLPATESPVFHSKIKLCYPHRLQANIVQILFHTNLFPFSFCHMYSLKLY